MDKKIKEIEDIKKRIIRASEILKDDEIYLTLGLTKFLLSYIEELRDTYFVMEKKAIWNLDEMEKLEIKIKELEIAIKKHKRENPWKTLPRKIDQELYDLVEKGGEDVERIS